MHHVWSGNAPGVLGGRNPEPTGRHSVPDKGGQLVIKRGVDIAY